MKARLARLRALREKVAADDGAEEVHSASKLLPRPPLGHDAAWFSLHSAAALHGMAAAAAAAPAAAVWLELPNELDEVPSAPITQVSK